ncbi:ATP-binding protein [Silicimonas sp. MF1-12-2]|uniref:ATP-binding protein n=1 Tax=Silicimonas sp. MF1-12-2 TaxID=3384793 RepID=UPI0039B5CE47
MITRGLKAYLPRSLYARAVLILLVPVITILLVVSVVFIQRLYENVTRQMTEGVAHELRLVLDRIEDAPDAAGAMQAAFDVAVPLGIQVSAGGTEMDGSLSWYDLSGRVVARTLRDEIPTVRTVDLAAKDGFVQLGVDTSKGPVLLELARSRVSARNPHQFLVLIGITAILMTAIALIYMRNQMRPIRRLARAADAFGKGRRVPYRPTGATEVRQAGAAFLNMMDRIERQIEQRTLMLSGVSHDLRTPLTRMKLSLSMMDESEDTEAMLRDVSDMEKMLDAFLDFARGEGQEEPIRIAPVDLARDAIERAKRGAMNVAEGEMHECPHAMLRRNAMGRALDNLIGNAVRYGNRAIVSVTKSDNAVRFVVDDEGPGIPEELRAQALKPFTRLDEARNQDNGSGVGLGLSIAADIAHSHGGTLLLEKSPALGGLRAILVIPL